MSHRLRAHSQLAHHKYVDTPHCSQTRHAWSTTTTIRFCTIFPTSSKSQRAGCSTVSFRWSQRRVLPVASEVRPRLR